MLFPLIDIASIIDYPGFLVIQGESNTSVLLKGVEWIFWLWLFYKNIEDAFNEDLSYITHFVVLHPFLRRSQILLTSIIHLSLIKSNLIQQKKLAFSFEWSSNNSIPLVHIANCRVYFHYMYIFYCNNFEHFFAVVTVVNCLL